MFTIDDVLAECDSFMKRGRRADSDFKESDHPRDGDGKFGSGGGTSSASSSGKSKAPFVNEFMKEHKSREQDMSRLSQMSDEKLNKALELLRKNNVDDEDGKYMRDLIKDVLKSSK